MKKITIAAILVTALTASAIAQNKTVDSTLMGITAQINSLNAGNSSTSGNTSSASAKSSTSSSTSSSTGSKPKVPGCATEQVNKKAYENYMENAMEVIKKTLGNNDFAIAIDEGLEACKAASDMITSVITGAASNIGNITTSFQSIDWKGAAKKVMKKAGSIITSIIKKVIGEACQAALSEVTSFIDNIQDELGINYALPFDLGAVDIQFDLVNSQTKANASLGSNLNDIDNIEDLANEIWP